MFLSQKIPACLVAIFALGIINVASATEKRITRNHLPPAVRRVADEQVQGATVRGYTTDVENGQREYEVEMMIGGRSKDVTIALDGRLIEIEQAVDLNSLPSEVLSGLRNKAGNGQIIKVESITKKGAVVTYEAQVHALAAGIWKFRSGQRGRR